MKLVIVFVFVCAAVVLGDAAPKKGAASTGDAAPKKGAASTGKAKGEGHPGLEKLKKKEEELAAAMKKDPKKAILLKTLAHEMKKLREEIKVLKESLARAMESARKEREQKELMKKLQELNAMKHFREGRNEDKLPMMIKMLTERKHEADKHEKVKFYRTAIELMKKTMGKLGKVREDPKEEFFLWKILMLLNKKHEAKHFNPEIAKLEALLGKLRSHKPKFDRKEMLKKMIMKKLTSKF